MLRTLAVGNAASSAPNRAAAEMTTSRGVMPASSARRAAVSRRSSLITAASASGFTPLSVRPTSTAKVSRSRPVCSSCEMSYSTAHKDERQCSASRRCQRPTAEPSRVKAGGRAESRRRYRGVARSAHRQESPRADAPCPVGFLVQFYFPFIHNTPTRKRSHQAQDIHNLAHITHASFKCSQTCDAYRAHRHGSESPYPGSTPGLNPCNHLVRHGEAAWVRVKKVAAL